MNMKLMKGNFIITFTYIIFILVASIFVFNFGYKNNYPDYKTKPQAKNGVLDLSTYNFSNNGLIKLRGDAEFYYNQLLTPDDFKDTASGCILSGYQNIHGIWNDFEIDGKPIGGLGYATYRLKIKVPKDTLYGFKIKEFDCAYSIWVNGYGPMRSGIVAKNKEQYKPSWKRNELYINSYQKKLDVVIQIANFSHRKGGPEDAIILGLGRDILKYKSTQIGISYLLFGILAIMAVYHLVLFFYRTKDRSILYFSLLNFAMTLRLLTTGEKIILDLFTNLTWQASMRIEYISYTIAVPIFLEFIRTFYPREINKTFVKIVTALSVFFIVFALVTPSYVFSYTPLVFQGVVVISAIYIFWALVLAMLRKKEHAFILFGGYFFFFLVIINDLMYYNKMLNTSFIMPLGLFVLVFSQAFVLSKRTSQAFADVEKLSSTLDKYNKELEQMVDNRVSEIKKQKEEIEKQQETLINQAEELKQINYTLVDLSKFKENMTHMIVHDLKNPLNVILNLTKDRIIRLAGKQMLNLVQNILDVQKYQETAMELQLDFYSVTKLVNQSLEQVQLLIDKKEIRIENNVNTQGKCYFDRMIMERVVVNLLTNAVSYVPIKGIIKLDYRLEGNAFVLEIFNQGGTIPDEEKDYIFSKYGHEKRRSSFFNASTGLGLTFCKMALDAHGGKIGYFNIKDQGVTFFISIPIDNKNKDTFDQKILELKNDTVQPQSHDLSQLLTVSDKLYLSTIKYRLEGLEIFEISKFKAILKELNSSYSVGVYIWIESMHKALQDIDEKQLNRLVALLNY